MNGKNFKRITALILVTLTAFALAACSGKSKTEKFLEKFKKILADYINLTGESIKNPNDEALKAQLEKINDKLEKATEEAKKLREDMSEEEQKDFDAKMQELFVKSLMPGG